MVDMKRTGTVVLVACILASVPVIGSFSPRFRSDADRVWRDISSAVGIIEKRQPLSIGVTIKPDGSCTTNGKEWVLPVPVKTQVTDAAQTVSGTIGVYNQNQGYFISCPTMYITLTISGVTFAIEDITTRAGLYPWNSLTNPSVSPPEGTQAIFCVRMYYQLPWGPLDLGHKFYYFNADNMPWNIVETFTATVEGHRLWRTQNHSPGPGRTSSPVFAAEVTEADQWVADPPAVWDMTYAEWNYSGTQTYINPPGWWVGPSAFISVLLGVSQHKGITGYTYADCAINWSSFPLNFDGRQYNGSALRLTGSGNKIIVDVHTAFAGDEAHGIIIGQPYLPDFSDFAVVDRGGDLLGTLRIEGGFKVDKRYAWTLAYGDPGDTLYPTVDEIRAIGQYSTPPGMVGLPYIDTDYEHQLWTPPLSFAINAESARAHKLI